MGARSLMDRTKASDAFNAGSIPVERSIKGIKEREYIFWRIRKKTRFSIGLRMSGN